VNVKKKKNLAENFLTQNVFLADINIFPVGLYNHTFKLQRRL
jgi:hypothetical protein